jgi:predicted aspartyl protease
MILGKVDALKQAIISLELHGPNGQVETFEAVIDTGYNGCLTVNTEIASRLQDTAGEFGTEI